MADTVNMPKLGFDMAEGTLVRWVKAEGENVNKGEILAEIETDKATVEVESPFSGVVARQLVTEQTSVPVGTAIAIIAAPGEKVDTSAPAPAVQEGAAGAAAVGPLNQAEEAPPAPAGAARPMETPRMGETPTPTAAVPPPAESGPVKASPLARKMARDAGIDLARVQGSGPLGRIVRKDIEEAAALPAAAPSPVAAPAPAAAAPAPAGKPGMALPLPTLAAGEIPADQHVPLERLRAAIARRMAEAKQQVPHFYVTHEYDMAAVMEMRKQANELLPDDQKLSVNDFIVKAAALALREFPNLNASLAGNEIVRHGHINMGVAVAVNAGLLTVVCRDADRKPLRVISHELKEMVVRARSGKVHPEDIEGSTFSISNLGMYDVEEFIAIINPPEAAILAIGSVKPTPVVVDGELKAGMRMRATISADHRVSDGAEAAQFMQRLAVYLEKPLGLLL
jgi:pyruvate dehydrogenase E2 component (dihydrolipoamide acetyltransferase)